LEALAFKLDMQHNFRFLGYVEQVGSLLSIGDIYCHLSFSDGLSNALLEAMAAGLPSVISRAGGNPEVVRDGHTGFTVPPGDEAAAAEKIIYLLDHPEVSSAVGEAARMEVRSKFTAEGMGRRFASLYDELLQKKPARRFSQIEPFERPNT
jgi:glycosyltransferase involved in cell wall biosynthesis